jgi:hypothetical protein
MTEIIGVIKNRHAKVVQRRITKQLPHIAPSLTFTQTPSGTQLTYDASSRFISQHAKQLIRIYIKQAHDGLELAYG